VTDQPTPTPPPKPEESDAEGAGEAPADGGAEHAPRKSYVMRFPRAPIPGTELAIRSPSFGQHSETAVDVANDELDDRAFTVRLVVRQLDTDVTAGEVEAWPDAQLLAAAQGYLSLTARGQGDDDDQGEDGDVVSDELAEPDTLTFTSVRAAIRRDNERRTRKMRKLIEGIGSLADSNAARFSELLKVNPDIFKTVDPPKGIDIGKLTGADAFKNLGVMKGLDAFKGIDLAQLSGTSKIAESIAKLAADTTAMERIAGSKLKLPEIPMSTLEHQPMTYIGPLVNPEVRLLEEVTETLERMHDDELRTSEGQIAVLVEVTTLLKKQGLALEVLVNDTRGQKWPRRALLATAVTAAIAAVLALAYSAGILRPLDAAPAMVSTPSPTPIVTSSPTPAPTATRTATQRPSPSPQHSPSAGPTESATP
jgi:hypothetical protein